MEIGRFCFDRVLARKDIEEVDYIEADLSAEQSLEKKDSWLP